MKRLIAKLTLVAALLTACAGTPALAQTSESTQVPSIPTTSLLV